MLILTVIGCSQRIWFEVRFLVVCFLYKNQSQPREKIFAVGKSDPNATAVNLKFLGLGWPWVGEFDGFIIMFILFPVSNPTELGKSQTP